MKTILIIILLAINTLAKSISYEDIVKQTIENNTELQILKNKKNIIQASIDEIDSLYYPVISLGINTQYTKDLRNDSSISSIGGNIFSDSSGYESSATLRIDYELYNFGVTNIKKEIETIKQNKIKYEIEEKIKDLKLKTLQIYRQILEDKNQLYYYKDIQKTNKKIYHTQKRLYKAKKIDKLNLSAQAIKIVELDTKIEQIKEKLKESFVELQYYTKEQYTLVDRFKKPQLIQQKEQAYENTPIYEQIHLEIRQKQKELQQLKKEQYPSIKLFSTYNLYEKNDNNLEKSLQLDERNYLIGIGVNITLFEGYKSQATKRKLQAQIKELNLQNTQYKKQYKLEKQQKQKELKTLKTNITNLQKLNNEYENKTNTINKLKNVNNIDLVSILEDEIKNYEKSLQYESVQIQKNIKLKQMQILGSKIQQNKATLKQPFQKIKKEYTHKTIKEANIRQTPFMSGKILQTLLKNTKVSIEYCNKYHWCKIKAKEAYIAQFLLEAYE